MILKRYLRNKSHNLFIIHFAFSSLFSAQRRSYTKKNLEMKIEEK